MITSAQLDQMPIEQLESITEPGIITYQLTDGELQWLEWIGGRYSIASLLWDSLDSETQAVTIDTTEINQALFDDGIDRCPCLTDDSQLNRLVWFIGPYDWQREKEERILHWIQNRLHSIFDTQD